MITVCLIWTKSISNGFSLVVSAATEFINLIGRAALQYLDLLACTCFKHCSRISRQFCDIYGVDCKHYCFSGMHLRFGHTCDHLGCKNEHYELLIWIHFQCQIYRCFFQWDKLSEVTGLTPSTLSSCLNDLLSLFCESAKLPHPAIREKYSKEK